MQIGQITETAEKDKSQRFFSYRQISRKLWFYGNWVRCRIDFGPIYWNIPSEDCAENGERGTMMIGSPVRRRRRRRNCTTKSAPRWRLFFYFITLIYSPVRVLPNCGTIFTSVVMYCFNLIEKVSVLLWDKQRRIRRMQGIIKLKSKQGFTRR